MTTIDVDDLAQIIRQVDGNHELGAGALAEAILDRLPAPQIIRTVEELHQRAGGSMNITPEQALELLDGATPGTWREDESNILDHDGDELLSDGSFGDPNWYNDRDITLMAAAPDLAQTIAGMRWEHGVEQATGTTQWFRSRPMAEAHAQVHGCFRLVRRLVGPVEVTE